FPFWNSDSRDGAIRRNSHLTSIAPTGTIALFAGNVSSGIEPVFSTYASRKVKQPDGNWKLYDVEDYAARLWKEHDRAHLNPGRGKHWVETDQLSPEAHLAMVEAVQPHVDSGVSKTINLPASISFEDFRDIYSQAYARGLKGCTTFRPNEVTGSLLSSDAMKE